jgi:extracellular factor (EF) 3-hydroxypalmitic acid methyl ester biosynthesis protein
MDGSENRDGVVMFQSGGIEYRAVVVRLARHSLVFEVYSPVVVLQKSESLTDFKLLVNERPVYTGKATVKSVIHMPTMTVCEVALEDGWLDVDFFGSADWSTTLKQDFQRFMEAVQQNRRVAPEFKIAVGDMQSALIELRRWLEQVELGIRAQPDGSRAEVERRIVQELHAPVIPLLTELFERFNEVCAGMPDESRAVHSYYAKRQLHPLVLCAPFMYRTFEKPLGFAGDYEMVNMMTRDPYEGGSIFAKLLNAFFLTTPPVVAHRNRLDYIGRVLTEETSRAVRNRRTARVFDLGCGPAIEIQRFIADSELSQHAEFTLLDFNDETVTYTDLKLKDAKARHQRNTNVQLIKKSVVQFLKESSRPVSKLGSFDVIYCAGLFDYLPKLVCEKLMTVFYDLVMPGGLVLATNVDSSNPSRNWMEYVVDWHLEYRSGKEMAALCPPRATADECRVESDDSGVNVFLKVRKPAHA